jgi:hypothetical protein
VRRLPDRGLWAIAVVIAALCLVAVRFTSEDPDSALYAGIADRLSQEPVARWVAPEWWGFWPEAQMTGRFREHPAGIFWLPAALGRVGIPPLQGAYVVGVTAALGALLLIGSIVSRLTASPANGRAVVVLLQIMPVAFIFRIRANHEYLMLFALTLMLAGLAGIGRSWRFVPLVAAGLVTGLLVKGVFVVLLLVAAGWWIAINPTGDPRGRTRGITAMVIGLAAMAVAAAAYDWQYQRVTGETFWRAYWERQLGPLDIATPATGGSTLVHNVAFYLTRLAWHPAPWSLALLWAAWRWRAGAGEAWRRAPRSARRGLAFALGFAGLSILVLAPSSRFAERYVFSGTYAVGAVGAVIALCQWPRLRTMLDHADAAVPAFPMIVWLGLLLLRLTAGSLLPRV